MKPQVFKVIIGNITALDLVMEFRDVANTSAVYEVLLPRFSLAVMQRESRYRWKHGSVSTVAFVYLFCRKKMWREFNKFIFMYNESSIYTAFALLGS